MRIVAQARSLAATVVRRSTRAVILHGHPVNRPRAGRVSCLTHGDIEAICTDERPVRVSIEREHKLAPALRVGVEVAAWISHEWAAHTGRSINGCRISIEGVEVH